MLALKYVGLNRSFAVLLLNELECMNFGHFKQNQYTKTD